LNSSGLRDGDANGQQMHCASHGLLLCRLSILSAQRHDLTLDPWEGSRGRPGALGGAELVVGGAVFPHWDWFHQATKIVITIHKGPSLGCFYLVFRSCPGSDRTVTFHQDQAETL